MPTLIIREISEGRGQLCDAVLRSLPSWFGIESAIQQYTHDVEQMPTFAAYVSETPAGFVALNHHNEWTAEIHIIAIRPEFHRRGIGRKLMEVSQEFLKNRGYEYLSVKTISASSLNKEYEFTRKFYFAMGFRPVEEIKELWGKSNPCLLMIKSL